MNEARVRALLLGFLLLAIGPAFADDKPAPPPVTPQSAPLHVTVPSLPGQENRQGVVKPQGGLQTDSEGYAVTKRLSTDTTPTKPPEAGQKRAAPASAGTAPQAPVPSIPVGPAPKGKAAVTGANYIHVLGVVQAFEPGKSITVKLQRTGSEVTYTLASGAQMPTDIARGDSVRVRVLSAPNVKGKVADRVEPYEAKAPPVKK